MDVTSYLLGKKSSGGGGGVDEYFTDVTTTTNDSIIKTLIKKIPAFKLGTNVIELSGAFRNYTELVSAPIITNISQATIISNMFAGCTKLVDVPNYNTSNATNMSSMFDGCSSLETAPQLDTSKVTNMANMYNYCSELKNVPQYNFESATSMTNMFRYCNKLTDQSIDNILASCIGAVNYADTKTLRRIGIISYSSSRIQALPHYQAFVNAGWSL